MFSEMTNASGFAALEPMCGCGLLGALKCVAGMDGLLPMIHGPVSCSSGHRLAMLYAGVEPLLPTTCIEQTQIVLGCAGRLERAMHEAWDKYHPDILLVLLSCATAMIGENYQLVAENYRRKTGKIVLILDGSALAGDEVDICPVIYDTLGYELDLKQGKEAFLSLEGFAKTDYAFSVNQPALKKLIEDSMEANYTPGLFAGGDPFKKTSEYRHSRKIPASLLWNRKGMEAAAPIGINGSYRFLNYLSRASGLPLKKEAENIYKGYAEKLAPNASALSAHNLPVAIEGAGWYAYALADFLKNELGCKVLLSVDRSAESIPWHDVCDEFYEDTGRFELVELMQDFGAKIVFGSSNVQLDESWRYVPFYQPVWRVVEAVPLLGYNAALALAEFLLRETAK